jgi:hypothetical protein
VEGGLVTRYAVLAGNPPEAPELPASRRPGTTALGYRLMSDVFVGDVAE